MIYLDNAATTFPKPESVYKIMDLVNRNYAVNAGRGSYSLANKATKLIDETKDMILNLVNANHSGKVIFAPSVTIALNQILKGIDFISGDIVYVSPYEHNAVARTLYNISEEKKIVIKEIPINLDTFEIDIDKMKYMFSKQPPKCVCSTYISNVTGYVLPIHEIFSEGKKYGAITVMDSAQAMGLVNMNLSEIPADFVAFAGHKTLYGPFGIAGFIDVNDVELKGIIHGGTGSNSLDLEMPKLSPNKYESASQNIVAIAGLNAALKVLDIEKVYQHEKELSAYLIYKLKTIKGVILYLPDNLNNHNSIVSFNIEGYKAEDIGMILDEDYDIAVRTGYHCAPFIHKYLNDEQFLGTVRIGLSQFSSKEDIDRLVEAILEMYF